MRYAGFSIPSRALIGLTTALVLLLYAAPLLLSAPLTDPDEGLHAAIAQEMHERGEIVVPSFLGEPFRDKPILFFWTQLASLAVFGMSEAAVRLPGLAFAILGVLTTGWLAATLFRHEAAGPKIGPRRHPPSPSLGRAGEDTKVVEGGQEHERLIGWIAAACYGTLAVPFALAQAPVHDVALVPMVNVALLALWNHSGRDLWAPERIGGDAGEHARRRRPRRLDGLLPAPRPAPGPDRIQPAKRGTVSGRQSGGVGATHCRACGAARSSR
jgi:hypothetical protein